ncbi:MAG: histidine phosphatase family protein [Hyphomicrobiales bacterium]|nr:histidine phosphatase family protein [Hyphomicrobiales bacterium]
MPSANGGAIYLARHGETEWNAQGRFQGALDSPLTPRGRDQAERLGRILAEHLNPAEPSMQVSPLGRARETASLLRRRFACAGPIIEPRLREVSLGSWDGLDMVEIHAEWPEALEGATAFDWYFRSPDGDSYEQVCARLAAWLEERHETVIVVSHGLTGRLLRGLYLGLSRNESLALTVPQDAVFKLADGRVETLTLSAATGEHAS